MSIASTSQDLTSCRILFSTQSGRARACSRRAGRIVREETTIRLENRGGSLFDDDVQDLHDLTRHLKGSKSFLLLFVSTTGDGDHTDTIRRTWQQL
jgi:hypothetical protein